MFHRTTWSRVSEMRTFFAHQSVGGTLLAGIRNCSSETGRVAAHRGHRETSLPDGPVLAHLYVGQNGDPMAKIRGFRQALEAGLGRTIDVAALKCCFWDVLTDTALDTRFDAYARTIAQLQTRFPRITFVHVTVLLFTRDGDWRAGVSPYLCDDYTDDGGYLNEAACAGAAALNVVAHVSNRPARASGLRGWPANYWVVVEKIHYSGDIRAYGSAASGRGRCNRLTNKRL